MTVQRHTDTISLDTAGISAYAAKTLDSGTGGVVAKMVELPDGSRGVVRSADTASTQQTPTLTTITGADQVQLSWDAVDGATSYEILRDGTLLATTTDTTFIDSAVKPGSQHYYVVQAHTRDTTPLADRLRKPGVTAENLVPETQAWGIPEKQSNRGPNGKPLPPPVENPRVKGGSSVMMAGTVQVPSGESESQVRSVLQRREQKLSQVNISTVRHQAFIKPPRAPAAACEWEGGYFGGDNRGFNPSSNRYRTQLEAVVDWPSATVYQRKSTHDTTHYSADGELLKRANAGTEGMDIFWYPDGTNTIQARFRAEHAIGNPFCVAGEITYDWRALLYRDGYYTLEGDHYPVPHHGIYLRNGPFIWQTIYEKENEGFICLIGVCGRDDIDAGDL